MTRSTGRAAPWMLGTVIAAAAAVLVAISSHRPAAIMIVAITGAGTWLWNRSVRAAARRRTNASAAHLSHELRTPLTSVLGIMDVLGDDGVALTETEQQELFALARGEALHMNHVVSNLVASSRISRNTLQPNLEPVNLPELVRQALDRVPTVEKRTFVDGDTAVVLADPALLLQIVLNLLQNVDRYAPQGEVEIEFTADDRSVSLAISDDGPGLEPEQGSVFRGGSSDQGLGLGLPLSRQLARLMNGDLTVGSSRREGATLVLTLPATTEVPAPNLARSSDANPIVALSPRAKVIVDMAEALVERSLDRVVAGFSKLCSDLIGASSLMLAVPTPDGRFERASSFGSRAPFRAGDSEILHRTLQATEPLVVASLTGAGDPDLADELGTDTAVLCPVRHHSDPVGVLVIGWPDPQAVPGPQGMSVATAVAELTAFALDRSALSRDAELERELRSSVMESLPIAISVFAGDPPRVVDWNERERTMLGLTDDIQRPSDLDATQDLFDVRFADGTPLTVDNAPVTQAIRSGRSAGPFLLRVRRLDGTVTVTRTHCAPFTDAEGNPVGAVVTSEELDIAPSMPAAEARERDSA